MNIHFPQGEIGEAAHIHNLGMQFWRAGDLDQALNHFLKALSMKERTGNLSAAASSIHMIGVVYAQRKDWENATRYFLRSLKIDASDRHHVGVAKSLNDIATMCGERGRLDAKSALVNLGNMLLVYARRQGTIQEENVAKLCSALPADLRKGVSGAIRKVMGWDE